MTIWLTLLAEKFVQAPRTPDDLPLSTKGVNVVTGSGRQTATAEAWAATVQALRPTLFETLSAFTDASKGKGRQQKVVQQATELAAAGVDVLGDRSRAFGVVNGGLSLRLRKQALEAVLALKCGGLSLGALGTDERADEREALLRELAPHLPADKPRMIASIDSIDAIVQCVALGVDLFVSDLPQRLAEEGIALRLVLDPADAALGADRSLRLRDAQYRLANEPLDAACGCHSCANYTRAYINHLLLTHEMLALTLLMVHNMHTLEQFFVAVRSQLNAGTFDEFAANIRTNRRREFDETCPPAETES